MQNKGVNPVVVRVEVKRDNFLQQVSSFLCVGSSLIVSMFWFKMLHFITF